MERTHFQLVGTARLLPPKESDGDVVQAFYSELIPRLLTEVSRDDGPSRLVGFRTTVDDQSLWQFLGIEVKTLRDIPADMTVLTLRETRGESRDSAGAGERFTARWDWIDQSGPTCVGEFDAAFPAELPGTHSFSMTVNALVGNTDSPSREDAIELVEYDASWQKQYESMAHHLRTLLPDTHANIAHYGSTSVPDMPAKPVIDILVEVPSFDTARRCLISTLKGASWEYWWYKDHMIFIKRDPSSGMRTHHVHVAPPGHGLWEGLAFRDYLVAHPETAHEYAALKQELATRFRTDREKYTDAKTAFIRAITDKALSGQE